jgi:putative transposase
MLIETLSMSERLACRAVGLSRSTHRRLPQSQTPTDPDMDVRAWLRSYATKHPCHGFRRAWAALRHDEGRMINVKRCTGCGARKGCSAESIAPVSGLGHPRRRK